MSGVWVEGPHQLPDGYVPLSASLSPSANVEGDVVAEHPLIEFLRARLDEREQTARAIEGNSPNWHTEVAREDPYDEHRACVRSGQGEVITDGIPARYADHIAANDPEYVLADVDSKRRTLVRCQEEMLSGIPRLVHFAEQTLREMARPYAGRDDYPQDQS